MAEIFKEIIRFDHLVPDDWYDSKVRSEIFIRVKCPPCPNAVFTEPFVKHCINRIIWNTSNKLSPVLPKPNEFPSHQFNKVLEDTRNKARKDFWPCVSLAPHGRTLRKYRDDITIDFLYRLYYYQGFAPGYRPFYVVRG
ncbi:hypothetical protein [Brevibacillus porteri]|uniref:hypothetical protein n=1 Tax=Brevibacillus porteri TaxID=2126350 RepID=UPI003D22E330